MASLTTTHTSAANPEPFQPYANYLALQREVESVKKYRMKYLTALIGKDMNRGILQAQPIDIQEEITRLSLAIAQGNADPAEILGYIAAYADLKSPNFDGPEEARNLSLKILEYFKCPQHTPSPYGEYILVCSELTLEDDCQLAINHLKSAAERGNLYAQYSYATEETLSQEHLACEPLEWLWAAAQGLYPPALAWWQDELLSADTSTDGQSFLNVEQGQRDEMAESLNLLSHIMDAPQDKQTHCLQNILYRQEMARKRNRIIYYPQSVLDALKAWEQSSLPPSDAVEELVKTLYTLAGLHNPPPINRLAFKETLEAKGPANGGPL